MRRYLAVAAWMILAACGGGGTNTTAGAGSGTTDAGPVCGEVRFYAGTYGGTFTGDDTGTWETTADEAGAVTGSGYSNDLRAPFTMTGTVLADGAMSLTMGSNGSIATTVISCTGAVVGTWINVRTSEAGAITGSRRAG